MNKFAENFWDDLYKKVGFKTALFIILIILSVPSIVSIYCNYQSDKYLEEYKTLIENLYAKDFELFLFKKEIYRQTMEIVDKRFDSMSWKGAEPVSEPPTPGEINNIYRQLLLVSDNDEILKRFMKLMSYSENDYCSPANRGEFINLLRIDLGKEKVNIRVDSIPYFRNHD